MKRIFLIDDDFALLTSDVIKEELKDINVIDFETPYDAWNQDRAPDLIIIDMSCIAPLSLGPHACYGAIAKLCEKFPGAPVIIFSAVVKAFMEEVRETLKDCAPDSLILTVENGPKGYETLLKVVRTLI